MTNGGYLKSVVTKTAAQECHIMLRITGEKKNLVHGSNLKIPNNLRYKPRLTSFQCKMSDTIGNDAFCIITSWYVQIYTSYIKCYHILIQVYQIKNLNTIYHITFERNLIIYFLKYGRKQQYISNTTSGTWYFIFTLKLS
jgi:hypothetical protein